MSLWYEIYNPYTEENLASKKDLKLINSLIKKCEKIIQSKFILKHKIEISSIEINWWNIFIDIQEEAYQSIWNVDLNIEFRNHFWEWYKFPLQKNNFE